MQTQATLQKFAAIVGKLPSQLRNTGRWNIHCSIRTGLMCKVSDSSEWDFIFSAKFFWECVLIKAHKMRRVLTVWHRSMKRDKEDRSEYKEMEVGLTQPMSGYVSPGRRLIPGIFSVVTKKFFHFKIYPGVRRIYNFWHTCSRKCRGYVQKNRRSTPIAKTFKRNPAVTYMTIDQSILDNHCIKYIHFLHIIRQYDNSIMYLNNCN